MQNSRHLCKRLASVSLGVKSSVECGLLCMKVKPLSAKIRGCQMSYIMFPVISLSSDQLNFEHDYHKMFPQSIFASPGAKLQLEAKGQDSGGTWWLCWALCPAMAISCQSVLLQKAEGPGGRKGKGCWVAKISQSVWLMQCRSEFPVRLSSFMVPHRKKVSVHSKWKTNASEVFCLGISGMLSIYIVQLRRTGVEM